MIATPTIIQSNNKITKRPLTRADESEAPDRRIRHVTRIKLVLLFTWFIPWLWGSLHGGSVICRFISSCWGGRICSPYAFLMNLESGLFDLYLSSVRRVQTIQSDGKISSTIRHNQAQTNRPGKNAWRWSGAAKWVPTMGTSTGTTKRTFVANSPPLPNTVNGYPIAGWLGANGSLQNRAIEYSTV